MGMSAFEIMVMSSIVTIESCKPILHILLIGDYCSYDAGLGSCNRSAWPD